VGYGFVLYRVRAGDTLTDIGQRFQATPECIAALNGIEDPDYLQANRRIRVPKRKLGLSRLWRKEGIFVAVRSGDTVTGLAEQYDSGVSDIMRYNRIRDPKRLAVGQILLLPGGQFSAASRVVRRRTVRPKQTPKAVQALPEGELAWPVEQGKFKITSRYGERHSRPHKGVDLSAPRGTPILAADGGVVIVASNNLGGYGKTVVLLHPNGLRTIYAHADRILVKMGQNVKRRNGSWTNWRNTQKYSPQAY